MACRPGLAPLVTDKAKGGQAFLLTSNHMAQCVSQIRVKKNGSFIDVPCSRCGFCLQNKRKEWSFRLQEENKQHTFSYFTTFTYSDENIVLGTSDDNRIFPILHKHDFQLFMKRLRKRQSRLSDKKIKYYAVGEYGSKTGRPHYHALLFSMVPELVDKLPELWGLGHTQCGTVTNDSIDYITKYLVTKRDYKHYLVPPFSCISNGIGIKHLEDNFERYKYKDTVINARGYKQKLPRYYRDKLNENRIIKDIKNKTICDKLETKRADKVRKLVKSHGNVHSVENYLYEQGVYNSKKIIESAKDGGTL